MGEFEEWLMGLDLQTLTEELKIEILSEANAMLQEEIVNVLRNISQK
jgi:hypothetical protein